MPLFQQSVLKKFLSQQEKSLVEKAYKKFTKYFHNPTIQENIRNSKEEQFQEGFLRELFGEVLGYTLNPNVPSALANPMPFKSYNDCGDVNHFNNPATNSNAGSIFSNLKNLF